MYTALFGGCSVMLHASKVSASSSSDVALTSDPDV